MDMIVRQAETGEAAEVFALIEAARAYFKKNGIDQWQHGQPNFSTVEDDIAKKRLWIVAADKKIIAIASFLFGEEPYYNTLSGGRWLYDGEYCAIHRVAVDPLYKGHGIAGTIFEAARKLCVSNGVKSLRIDTHRDNKSMARAIEKFDFIKCGVVQMGDGSERLAFERYPL